MSLRPKRLHIKKSRTALSSTDDAATPSSSSTLPAEIKTSWDLKRAHNHRALPTVTPRRIVGTYTFSAPPGTSRPPDADPNAPSPPDPHRPQVDGVELNQQSDAAPDDSPSEHLLKTTKQADTWATKVIPSLVPIYLHLLRTTQSLTRPPIVSDHLCTCGGKVTSITVSCLYFDCERSSILLFLVLIWTVSSPALSPTANMSMQAGNSTTHVGGLVCVCPYSPNSRS